MPGQSHHKLRVSSELRQCHESTYLLALNFPAESKTRQQNGGQEQGAPIFLPNPDLDSQMVDRKMGLPWELNLELDIRSWYKLTVLFGT